MNAQVKELLKAENLSFDYGADKFTLKDVSLDVFEKDFISVIGRNGSGKSTLVKLLSGIHKHPAGKIVFKGKDISEYERKDLSRSLCYLPQSGIMLTDKINVTDFLLLGRYSYKNFSEFRYSDADIAIVEESLKTAGIYDFKDREMSELSGGERQKVLITLALVQLNLSDNLEEKLLIVDEPLTYLDVNYQHEIFSILQRLNAERGLTVVVVMHDLNLALKYTNKTILLNEGRMVFSGKTGDIITVENLREHFLIESAVIKNNNETIINFLPKNN